MTLSKLFSILEPQLLPLVTASPGGCVQKSSFTQQVLLCRARERSTHTMPSRSLQSLQGAANK